MSRYFSPQTLEEAVLALSAGAAGGSSGGRPRVVAGGTDVFPGLGEAAADFAILDISATQGLRGITRSESGWRIGAATTWSELARAPLPRGFDALKAAARAVGSVQIQNCATVAGNICNASPAADGVPPLLTLDAQVELASLGGLRRMALADFLLGVRRTALAPDELLSAIHVPDMPEQSISAFAKLGTRRHLVISVAMLAVLVTPDASGRVKDARIAVGACAPVARRLPALEAALRGVSLAQMAAQVAPEHLAPLAPIDDLRASGHYRLTAVEELLRRTLSRLCGSLD